MGLITPLFDTMKPLYTISLALVSWSLISIGAALAKPLTVGAYQGPGNHTMFIASTGDRICYQSMNRGITVASVAPDPAHRGMYRLDGNPNFALYQPSANTLVYGELNQLTRAKAISLSNNPDETLLKKCLSSSGPFFKKSLNNRGG
jgi:hypothetical protein